MSVRDGSGSVRGPSPRALALVLGIACGWAGSASAAGAPELPDAQGWVEAGTEHFTVTASTNAKRARASAVELERLRGVLEWVLPGFGFSSGVPTSVFLFRNARQLEPYDPGDGGGPQGAPGYGFETPFRAYLVLDAYSDRTDAVYYQLVRSLLRTEFHELPPWLCEGLAAYVGTFHYDESSARAWVGDSIEDHRLELAGHEWLSLGRLFAIGRASPEYADPTQQERFYALSWLLVHYLIGTEESRVKLPDLLRHVRDGEDAGQALYAMLDTDEAELTRRLHVYADQGSPGFRLEFPGGAKSVEPSIRDLDEATVLVRLGDLLVHYGAGETPAAARAHLDAAVAAGADPSGIRTLLGIVHEREGDLAAAERAYRDALELHVHDAEALTRLGGLLLGRAWSRLGFEPGSELPADVAEARSLFRRALEENPSNAEALAGMGTTYLFDPAGLDIGARLLAGAATLDPDRKDYAVRLAMLLASHGRAQAAWTIIDDRIVDEDQVLLASEWALRADIEAAGARFAAGDVDGAREVLSAAAVLAPSRLRSRLDELRPGRVPVRAPLQSPHR